MDKSITNKNLKTGFVCMSTYMCVCVGERERLNFRTGQGNGN